MDEAVGKHTFKVVVKNGSYGYQNGEYGNQDLVINCDTLRDALENFLAYAPVEYGKTAKQKVTLTYTFKPDKS